MKKILLFLCLLLLATSCATVSVSAKKTHSEQPSPSLGGGRGEVVYYTGDDKPAASSGVVTYSNRSPLTPKGGKND
ncbi:MAG: hypothetical protein LBF81_05405 [Prevotellaceae bacterium]|nr:hypothetical protein [Prevotellaceae bacterium]